MYVSISILLISFVVSCLASCQQQQVIEATLNAPVDLVDTLPSTYKKRYVNTELSRIGWSGSKMMGTHHGTIDIAIGTLFMENGQLKGGQFIVDMNTMDNLDLKGTWPHDGLLEQLKSPDFFSIDSFPTSSFEISSVQPLQDSVLTHTISGNLTIKGITNNISFPATVAVTDNLIEAHANFTIDRADWDIRFGSKAFYPELLPIKTISNDIVLDIKLVADIGP